MIIEIATRNIITITTVRANTGSESSDFALSSVSSSQIPTHSSSFEVSFTVEFVFVN